MKTKQEMNKINSLLRKFFDNNLKYLDEEQSGLLVDGMGSLKALEEDLN